MGLFDIFKPKKKQTRSLFIRADGTVDSEKIKEDLYKSDPHYRETADHLAHQDKLSNYLGEAEMQYRADQDIHKLISAYEAVFIDAKPPLNSSSDLKLADLYIKAKQNDKAWGYLNMLLAEKNERKTELSSIRQEQAKLLKKEKKHKDAIEMFALAHLAKGKYADYFNENKFLKDIGVSARALGWGLETQSDIAKLVKTQINQRNMSEKKIIDAYQKYLQDHGL